MVSMKDTASPSEDLNDQASPDTANATAPTSLSSTESRKEDGDVDQEADEPKSEPTSNDAQSSSQPLRRSSRRSHRPVRLSNELFSAPPARKKRLASSKIMTEPSRQNPKRKASEPARRANGLPSDLLSEALRPLESSEIEEWDGWIELESEPVSLHVRVVSEKRLIKSFRHFSILS